MAALRSQAPPGIRLTVIEEKEYAARGWEHYYTKHVAIDGSGCLWARLRKSPWSGPLGVWSEWLCMGKDNFR